jgi:hypothetical protein
VKCSLIDQYVKKQSGHGTSTFNGSSVIITSIWKLYLMSILQMKEENQNNKLHVHMCGSTEFEFFCLRHQISIKTGSLKFINK